MPGPIAQNADIRYLGKLLGDVIDYAKTHKTLPAKPQDEQFATNAPSLGDSKH